MESRSGTLENGQANERALDLDAFLSAHSDLDISGLLAILGKAVRMRLAINLKTRPANSLDANVGNMNVLVLLNEMAAEDGSIQLRRVDGVLLGGNIDGVLDRVGGNDNTVIGLGVGGLNLSLEKTANGHFCHGLNTSRSIAVDFADADIVLAIASSRYVRHCDSFVVVIGLCFALS
jgi:hypothetical protein